MYKEVIDILKAKSLKLALAESCTAGMVSSLLADVPGASEVLFGSYVCYTKDAKISMLGLDGGELDAYGLASKETATAMAKGALEKSGASLAAAVTGIAGPLGDGSRVPVGTVWVAVMSKDKGIFLKEYHFDGFRNEVRAKAADIVIKNILESL